jgi:integrase
MTPLQQISGYERDLRARGLSERTIKQRLTRMRRVQADLDDLRKVDQLAVATWLAGFDGWTRLTYHSDLASIFDFLVKAGMREEHPMRDETGKMLIRKPPQPDAQPHPFTRAQETAVLTAAAGDTRAWLLLARHAGLRASEIAHFCGEHIDSEWIRVTGKGGKLARIPTHLTLWNLAQEYPREGRWFDTTPKSLSMRAGNFLHGLGMGKGGIHRMRSTFGTRLIEAGVPLSEVQRLMRHSSLVSTQHYLGTDDTRLRRAIELGAA